MKRTAVFFRRCVKEMLRDPISYIFCLGFPVVMLVLFAVIAHFSGGNTPVFALPSLLPGILMFSYSFVMLVTALLVSSDRTGAFLMRLYTSPMRTREFVFGYVMTSQLIGLAQSVIALLAGWALSAVTGEPYFSLGRALLLLVWMFPVLLLFVFLGFLFGTVLNSKSAPGLCSVLISGAGILGGAWMPLDAMGGFEVFCRALPFYPAVYIGRIITGAIHTVPTGTDPVPLPYVFDRVAALGLIPVVLWLAAAAVLSLVAFARMAKSDRK